MDPPPAPKLRLMCSYGGHILPRPHDKSLFYSGGDTRIVAVDRLTSASSLPSFLSHLSKTLNLITPSFSLKYQLPGEDLDSLVSVATDDDLHNMLDELHRLESSPRPARIRLFLFPSPKKKPEESDSSSSGFDGMAESWFRDVLKGVRVVDSGGPESIALETSSSFGSTGSSVSMSNLPPVGMVVEDGLERKVDNVVSPGSVER